MAIDVFWGWGRLVYYLYHLIFGDDVSNSDTPPWLKIFGFIAILALISLVWWWITR